MTEAKNIVHFPALEPRSPHVGFERKPFAFIAAPNVRLLQPQKEDMQLRRQLEKLGYPLAERLCAQQEALWNAHGLNAGMVMGFFELPLGGALGYEQRTLKDAVVAVRRESSEVSAMLSVVEHVRRKDMEFCRVFTEALAQRPSPQTSQEALDRHVRETEKYVQQAFHMKPKQAERFVQDILAQYNALASSYAPVQPSAQRERMSLNQSGWSR